MPLLDNYRASPIFRELRPFMGGAMLTVLLFFISSIYIGGVSQKDRVLGDASSAQIELAKAYESFSIQDFERAGFYFQEAGSNFERIDETLSSLAKTLEPVGAFNGNLHLARAGQSVASAGYFFSKALDSTLALAQDLSEIIVLDKKTAVEPKPVNIQTTLKKALADFYWSKEFINIAVSEAGNSRPGLAGLLGELQTAITVLTNFNSLLADLVKPESTVVILFQNSAEARPGGGFIGSYGRLRLGNDNVESLLIESIYQIDGQLKEKIDPPAPLRFIAGDSWAMRDSNWWPDFKMSAQNAAEFYKKETGETADAVIAFTPEVFEAILSILGEVAMPQYNEVLTKNNFYQVLQRETSQDYDKVLNRPKKFMADLAAVLLGRLPELSADKKIAILRAVLLNLNEKNILFYSRHAEAQAKIEALGLGGRLVDLDKSTSLDGLLITNANVGGGKSDRFIGQKVSLETKIGQSGAVSHELVVTRENRVPEGLEHPNNVNYQRIYVPRGSTLISSSREVTVFEELGRTVFATTSTLRPGEASELKVSYELPSRFFNPHSYSLLVEKNPGQKIDNFKHSIVLPPGHKIIHNVGDTDIDFINSDKFLGFVIDAR